MTESALFPSGRPAETSVRVDPLAGRSWPIRDLYAVVGRSRKLAERVEQTAALQPHERGVARILLYFHTGFSYGWISF
jgi:hypothetical protein